LRFEACFRADLVVEDLVIVELKSIEEVAPVHKKILLTYLRLADKRLGLLLTSARKCSKTASIAWSTVWRRKLTQRRKGTKRKRIPASPNT
jgi:GxxExxY protein